MTTQHHSKPGRARSLWLALTSVALGAGVLAWSPGAARACSCAMPQAPAEAIAGAAAVFEGVARGEAVLVPGVVDPATHVAAVKQTFEVTRRWKGEIPARIEVFTAEHDSSCGKSYAAEQRYVVYAASEGGRLWDSSCSRSRVVGSASDDLTALGPGMPPLATDAGADAGGSGADSDACTFAPGRGRGPTSGFLVVATFALVAFARRRLTRR
jgi:hypothetical protein